MVLITIVNGVYKQTYNWGAPHCIYHVITIFRALSTDLIPFLKAPGELLLGIGDEGTNQGASELLNITVGTQSISPLYWAIESGSLNTAKAMLEESHLRIEG